MGSVLEIILGILGALLVLTVLVVAHEYGHYKIGRILNFKILEFGVGFGPKLFKWVKNGIMYSIRLLPLGGFTKFYGEDEEMEDQGAFNKQPVGKRAAVIAAGPIMNIIFAWILAVIFLCAFGDFTPTVGSVIPGSPAEAAGLAAGDKILEINGHKIDFSAEASEYFTDGFITPPTFQIERNGQRMTIKDIATYYDAASKRNIIGFVPGSQPRYYGFFEAIGLSFKWLFVILKLMITGLFGLIFAGKGAELAMGPVGTIGYIGQVVTARADLIVQLGALLSVNLAIINLLPFPALDGGRLVFLLIEKIRKKPLPKNAEGYLNFAGFVILMLLMALLTYQDIARMIS